jgi:leucyl-tRNA synthetase
MIPGLKRAAGLVSIQVIAVEEGSKKGKDLTNNDEEVDVTTPIAEAALPGQPSFFFSNV